MSVLAQQGDFRALQLFDQIPPGHSGAIVTSDAFQPHLRCGEIAVVDLNDRAPMHGELFLIQHESLHGRVAPIVQMFGREVLDEHLKPWTGWFARYQFVRPGEIVLSDGPMRAEPWSEKRCVGRIVGYIAPLWDPTPRLGLARWGER